MRYQNQPIQMPVPTASGSVCRETLELPLETVNSEPGTYVRMSLRNYPIYIPASYEFFTVIPSTELNFNSSTFMELE